MVLLLSKFDNKYVNRNIHSKYETRLQNIQYILNQIINKINDLDLNIH